MEKCTSREEICSFCLNFEDASNYGKKTMICGHKICFQCIQDQWLMSECNDSEVMECTVCRQMSANTVKTTEGKQDFHLKPNGLDSTTGNDVCLTRRKDTYTSHTTPSDSRREHGDKIIPSSSPIRTCDLDSGVQMYKNDTNAFTSLEDELSNHEISGEDGAVRKEKEKCESELKTKSQEDNHPQKKNEARVVPQNAKKNISLSRNPYGKMKLFSPLPSGDDAHTVHISNRENITRYNEVRNISKSCPDLFQQTANDQKKQVKKFESCLDIVQDFTRLGNPVSQHEAKIHHDVEWDSLFQYFDVSLSQDPKPFKERLLCSPKESGECSLSSSYQYSSPMSTNEDFWRNDLTDDNSTTGCQSSYTSFLENAEEGTSKQVKHNGKSSKHKTYVHAVSIPIENNCEKKVEANTRISFTRKSTMQNEQYAEGSVVSPSDTKCRTDSDKEEDDDISLYISCRESPNHGTKIVSDSLRNHNFNQSNRDAQSEDILVRIKETYLRHLEHIQDIAWDTLLIKRSQAEFILGEREQSRHIKDDLSCSRCYNLEICRDISQISLAWSLIAQEAIKKVRLLRKEENLTDTSSYQMLPNIMNILLQQVNFACTVSCGIAEDIDKKKTCPCSKKYDRKHKCTVETTPDTNFISHDDTANNSTKHKRLPRSTRFSGNIEGNWKLNKFPKTVNTDTKESVHTSSETASANESECQSTDFGNGISEVIPLITNTDTLDDTTVLQTQSATQEHNENNQIVEQTEGAYSAEHNARFSFTQKCKGKDNINRMTFALDSNQEDDGKQQTNTETPVKVDLNNKKGQSLFEGDPLKYRANVNAEASSHISTARVTKTNGNMFAKDEDLMTENGLKSNCIGKQKKYLSHEDEIHSRFNVVLDELESLFTKEKCSQISEVGKCKNIYVKNNFRVKQPLVVTQRLDTNEITKKLQTGTCNSEVKQKQKDNSVGSATSTEDTNLITANNKVTSQGDTNSASTQNDVTSLGNKNPNLVTTGNDVPLLDDADLVKSNDDVASLDDTNLVTINNDVTSWGDTNLNLVITSNDVNNNEPQQTTDSVEHEKPIFNDVQKYTAGNSNRHCGKQTGTVPVKLYSTRDIVKNPILVKKIVDKLRETFSPKGKRSKSVNHEGTQVSESDLIPFDNNVRKSRDKEYRSTRNLRSVKRNLRSSYSAEIVTSVAVSQSPAKYRKLNDGTTSEVNTRSRRCRFVNYREKDVKNSKRCDTKSATTIADSSRKKGSKFHKLCSAPNVDDRKHLVTGGNKNIKSSTTISRPRVKKFASCNFLERMGDVENENLSWHITFTLKGNIRDVCIQTDLTGQHNKLPPTTKDIHEREVSNEERKPSAHQKAKTFAKDSKSEKATSIGCNKYDSKKLGNKGYDLRDKRDKIFTKMQKSNRGVDETNTRKTTEDRNKGQRDINTSLETSNGKAKHCVYSTRHSSSSEEDNIPLAHLPEFNHRWFKDHFIDGDDLPQLVYPRRRRLRRAGRCDRQDTKDFLKNTSSKDNKGTSSWETCCSSPDDLSARKCESVETEKTEVRHKKRSSRQHRFLHYSSSEECIPPARKRGIHYIQECLKILDKVYNHDISDPFRHEVKSKDIPDYYVTVKRGMCFDLIAYKLRNNIYEDLSDFVADMRLIFHNCRLYYKDMPKFCKAADEVEKYFNKIFHLTFSSIINTS